MYSTDIRSVFFFGQYTEFRYQYWSWYLGREISQLGTTLSMLLICMMFRSFTVMLPHSNTPSLELTSSK